MQIDAILSDYDGTLCPAAYVKGNGGSNSKIPPKLDKILWNISKEIPVCIVSSKDFFFLHDKTKFAKVVSCMMGIETLVLNNHHYSQGLSGNKSIDDIDRTSSTGLQGNDDNFQCISTRHILTDKEILQNNSGLLRDIVNEIALNFKDISVEQKFTIDKEILAGVTFDYRHNIEDWQSYKQNTEPLLKQAIHQKIIMLQKQQQQKQYKSYPIDENEQQLYIQTYSTHPFIDLYNIKSDKAMAFDITVSQLASFADRNIMTKKVLYLGDSENDNPAFRKADVSIGVRSDKRVNPKLDSKYTIEFNELAAFLERLQNNDFVFSNNLLN
jgi:hydroxymethylpyrimidine pyrophosphatase-like HAD family hydrolase